MIEYADRKGVPIASKTQNAPAFAKFTAIIEKVNGRATTHTYSAPQIVKRATDAEAELDAAGFTQRERVGTVVEVHSGGPRAASYNGRFVATCATLVRRADGWYLTAVRTEKRHAGNGASARMSISIPQSTAEAVQRRVLAAFSVRERSRNSAPKDGVTRADTM